MKKKETSYNYCDIVILYQDFTAIECVTPKLQNLDVSIKTLSIQKVKARDLLSIHPKIILLSSNNIAQSIEFYSTFLEHNKDKMFPHSAVVLTSNKESQRAFIACENGLFENYAIINPLNEPFRLVLVVLQALKMIDFNKEGGITQLIKNGGEKLADCIEIGSKIKRDLNHEMENCQGTLTTLTNDIVSDKNTEKAVQQAIKDTFEQLTSTFNSQFSTLFEQLVDASKIQNEVVSKLSNKKQSTDKKSSSKVQSKQIINLPIRKKVLIGEHSINFFSTIVDIFEEEPIEVISAQDGEEALAQFKIHQPDVVILSYELPKFNGIDVTQKIRNSGSSVPIVALSNQKDRNLIKRWMTLGLAAYLIKPSNSTIIKNTVLKELDAPSAVLKGQSRGEITWLPEYSVGNDLMDSHHKQLFYVINEFFKCTKHEKMLLIFGQLLDYIELHFNVEERMLQEINFPKFDDHVKKHNQLLNKVKILQTKLNNKENNIHQKIALFLYKWLADHILKSDMEYKSFCIVNK